MKTIKLVLKRRWYDMIERGEKNVTIYNIERIASALKVRPGSLLD